MMKNSGHDNPALKSPQNLFADETLVHPHNRFRGVRAVNAEPRLTTIGCGWPQVIHVSRPETTSSRASRAVANVSPAFAARGGC